VLGHGAGGDVGLLDDRPDLLASLALGDDLGDLGTHQLLGQGEGRLDVTDPRRELLLGGADRGRHVGRRVGGAEGERHCRDLRAERASDLIRSPN
jgi:hypothetical protein